MPNKYNLRKRKTPESDDLNKHPDSENETETEPKDTKTKEIESSESDLSSSESTNSTSEIESEYSSELSESDLDLDSSEISESENDISENSELSESDIDNERESSEFSDRDSELSESSDSDSGNEEFIPILPFKRNRLHLRQNPPRQARPKQPLIDLFSYKGQLLTEEELLQIIAQELCDDIDGLQKNIRRFDEIDWRADQEEAEHADEPCEMNNDESCEANDDADATDPRRWRHTTGSLQLPNKPRSKTTIVIPKTPVDLNQPINTLEDLIKLGETFEIKETEKYAVNMQQIKRLAPILKRLNDLVGMTKIKAAIADHLIFMLSGLNDKEHMMHTMIYGPPGCGKTCLALVLSDIYKALGYSNGKFKIVKRSDLVAGYLGQTTLKTQKVINEIQGGVLFIDEAYSLGDREGRDSFSKEIIDCLNQNLSEKRSSFICIIAGYQNELEKCFFAANPGLKRRFPFQYTIESYDARQLSQIFQSMLKNQNWDSASDLTLDHIDQNIQKNWGFFKQQGGDVETLTLHCKMAHSKRIFGHHQVEKRQINQADFDQGLTNFVAHKKLNQAKVAKSVTETKADASPSSAKLQKLAKTYAKQLKAAKII